MKVKVQLEELKAAIAEIEGRTKDVKVVVEFEDRKVKISAMDRMDNMIEVVLFEDGNMGAQFRCTERLMFMKGKKTL